MEQLQHRRTRHVSPHDKHWHSHAAFACVCFTRAQTVDSRRIVELEARHKDRVLRSTTAAELGMVMKAVVAVRPVAPPRVRLGSAQSPPPFLPGSVHLIDMGCGFTPFCRSSSDCWATSGDARQLQRPLQMLGRPCYPRQPRVCPQRRRIRPTVAIVWQANHAVA